MASKTFTSKDEKKNNFFADVSSSSSSDSSFPSASLNSNSAYSSAISFTSSSPSVFSASFSSSSSSFSSSSSSSSSSVSSSSSSVSPSSFYFSSSRLPCVQQACLDRLTKLMETQDVILNNLNSQKSKLEEEERSERELKKNEGSIMNEQNDEEEKKEESLKEIWTRENKKKCQKLIDIAKALDIKIDFFIRKIFENFEEKNFKISANESEAFDAFVTFVGENCKGNIEEEKNFEEIANQISSSSEEVAAKIAEILEKFEEIQNFLENEATEINFLTDFALLGQKISAEKGRAEDCRRLLHKNLQEIQHRKKLSDELDRGISDLQNEISLMQRKKTEKIEKMSLLQNVLEEKNSENLSENQIIHLANNKLNVINRKRQSLEVLSNFHKIRESEKLSTYRLLVDKKNKKYIEVSVNKQQNDGNKTKKLFFLSPENKKLEKFIQKKIEENGENHSQIIYIIIQAFCIWLHNLSEEERSQVKTI